jgi:hypothetical protein
VPTSLVVSTIKGATLFAARACHTPRQHDERSQPICNDVLLPCGPDFATPWAISTHSPDRYEARQSCFSPIFIVRGALAQRGGARRVAPKRLGLPA